MDIVKQNCDEHHKWLRFVLNPSLLVPDIRDWHGLYEFVCQQTIAGICEPTRFSEVHPDTDVLLEWIGSVERLRGLNRLQNRQIDELVGKLKKEGFHCCILKGQGNATMYPDGELRTPGDIDVWIDTDEETLIEHVRRKFPEEKEGFKHIKYPVFKDTGVDMHYTPLRFVHPKYNKRLQQWIKDNKEQQMTHYVRLANTETAIAIPTAEFNVVYQLGHLMIHLFSWGIGFRQLVDYFYVLKSLEGISDAQKTEIVEDWKYLGLSRMASAVMWIETEILGLPEGLALIKPNRYLGRIVFADIMKGGNFGKYNKGYKYPKRGILRRLYSLYRLLKFFPFFPREVISRIMKRSKALFVDKP